MMPKDDQAFQWQIEAPYLASVKLTDNTLKLKASLKLGFLRPSTLCPIFVFFFKDWCFLCDFSSNLFSSKLPSIFTKNETFCEHKGLLKVFGTMRLTVD